ncbi:expressed unknown protein [Seminavis robusta]|uniref:Uncharacterized protein n=1 Tax=Seminavis robusta TaxID=568900 RepID=A0A9N8DZC5_9STRA|nr:expressed unknown protein [Seminavis robusta]|eukprot:Sro396_g134280.1 n/a (340) ;mRNA; f:32969-33988
MIDDGAAISSEGIAPFSLDQLLGSRAGDEGNDHDDMSVKLEEILEKRRDAASLKSFSNEKKDDKDRHEEYLMEQQEQAGILALVQDHTRKTRRRGSIRSQSIDRQSLCVSGRCERTRGTSKDGLAARNLRSLDSYVEKTKNNRRVTRDDISIGTSTSGSSGGFYGRKFNPYSLYCSQKHNDHASQSTCYRSVHRSHSDHSLRQWIEQPLQQAKEADSNRSIRGRRTRRYSLRNKSSHQSLDGSSSIHRSHSDHSLQQWIEQPLQQANEADLLSRSRRGRSTSRHRATNKSSHQSLDGAAVSIAVTLTTACDSGLNNPYSKPRRPTQIGVFVVVEPDVTA